jgi:uncharacterized membrane protein YkoI
MNMRRHLILTLAMVAIFAGLPMADPVHARQDKRERAEQRDQRDQRDQRGQRDQRDQRDRGKASHKGVLTRDEAARRAQRQHGGRVLSVDLLQSDDAPARYRIKLLSGGNVRTVDVDALED